MTFLHWNTSHATGISIVDKQHDQIAEKINQLYKLIGTNEHSQIVEVLKELNKLMDEHFSTENALMKEHKVFNYFSHKAQHDRLSRILDDNLDDIIQKEKDLTPQYLILLRDWTINHLKFHDKPMADDLKSKGVA